MGQKWVSVDKNRLTEFRDWSEGAILSLNPFRTPDETAREGCALRGLVTHVGRDRGQPGIQIRDEAP